MATTQTSRTMNRKEARAWLDEQGMVTTRLPKNDERLEILGVDYSQRDLMREGDVFTLVTTKITS